LKSAFITGISGQDGFYLAKLLLSKGYLVYGFDISQEKLDNDFKSSLKEFIEIDLSASNSLVDIVKKIKPDEFYHLAAYHFSSQKDGNLNKEFEKFNSVNFKSTNIILNSIKLHSPKTKFFYSSSCQVFGDSYEYPQSEKTKYNPLCYYSISKVASTYLCDFYRKKFNIHASVGILYNHESPRRDDSFITTQIINAAIDVFNGKSVKLEINNLNAEVDWGSAEDYVEAMWLILQCEKSDNYIISSGHTYTIQEFANLAFSYFNLDFSKTIFQKKNILNLVNKKYFGNNEKLKKATGWKPKNDLKSIIKSMIISKIKS